MRRIVILAAMPLPALAEAPDVQTPSPVIFLSDNLGEEAGLGWCIDTVGCDFAETLHTHSCKPQDGDVQFALRDGALASGAFEGYCAAAGAPHGLVTCDAGDPATCLAMGEQIDDAGPFRSRDLILASCEEVPAERAAWTVRD